MKHRVEVRHVVVIPHGNQNTAGSRMQAPIINLRLVDEIELLESLAFGVYLARINSLRDGEQHVEKYRERRSPDGGSLLREEIRDGHEEQSGGGQDQAKRNFRISDPKIQRDLVLLVLSMEAQDQHAQRVHEEAPDYAERIRFAE